jgi:hypothetical protein
MDTVVETLLHVNPDVLKVVAQDFEDEAKKAITEARFADALQDPKNHEKIVTEISTLHRTLITIRDGCVLVTANLLEFDAQKISDGNSGVIQLTPKWISIQQACVKTSGWTLFG